MSGNVLVAYGTKHGSTREVAEAVAEVLRECGFVVDALAADRVDYVAPHDAVVVGGAIYMGRWHPAAAAFLERHRKQLAVLPVAVFGMGPRTMDAGAKNETRAQLDKAIGKVPEIHPVTVEVFGGVVDPDVLRFPFSRMAACDARDWAAVRAWALAVADAFDYGKAADGARYHRSELQHSPR